MDQICKASKQASKEGMTDHHDGSVSLHAWKQVDQTGEEIWPTNSSRRRRRLRRRRRRRLDKRHVTGFLR